MLIKLLEVNKEYVKTARGGYNKAQVVYESNGNRKTHNLMDFSNKQVFNTIVTANIGDSFEVATRQNDKGYAEWASAEPASAAATSTPSTTPARSAPTSNYETREERALRQRLIVRQSSLSAAVATLTPGSKTALNPDEVEALAERYNAFVFAEPKLFDQPNDLGKDDIPF